MDIINWLNTNQGMAMSALTLVYVVATILILKANSNSVKEMKITREEENRPYVIVYFESKTSGPVNLVVKNIGKTIAKNTRIHIDPELEHPKSRPINKSNLLNRPIPNLPLDFEYKAFVGMRRDLKEDDIYPVYDVKVTYYNYNQKNTYKENYVIDLNFEKDLLVLMERDIHDLAKDFKDYKNENKRQLKAISSSLKSIAEKNEHNNQI